LIGLKKNPEDIPKEYFLPDEPRFAAIENWTAKSTTGAERFPGIPTIQIGSCHSVPSSKQLMPRTRKFAMSAIAPLAIEQRTFKNRR